MTPILDAVKANALRLLRRRADQPDRQGQERRPAAGAGRRVPRLRRRRRRPRWRSRRSSPCRPSGTASAEFVNGLIAEGGGDAPESGLEAVALAMNSPWTTAGDRRRQVIVVWTDQPAHPLDPSVVPADLAVPGAGRLQRADRRVGGRAGPDGLQLASGSSCSRRTGPAGATSPPSGRTWCITRPRPAAGCPRSTTARSSTPSATRCERAWTAQLQASPDRTPDPTLSFGFNLAKIADQGEDSDPILRDGPDLGLIGVFDGMGGAGGTVYETPDGPRTGAYLASRIARDVVERRMLDLLEPDWNLDGRGRRGGPATVGPEGAGGTAGRAQGAAEPAAVEAAAGVADHHGVDRAATDRNAASRPGPVTSSGPVTRGRTSFDRRPGLQQLSTDDLREPGDAMANLTATRWSATRCLPTPTSSSTTGESS